MSQPCPCMRSNKLPLSNVPNLVVPSVTWTKLRFRNHSCRNLGCAGNYTGTKRSVWCHMVSYWCHMVIHLCNFEACFVFFPISLLQVVDAMVLTIHWCLTGCVDWFSKRRNPENNHEPGAVRGKCCALLTWVNSYLALSANYLPFSIVIAIISLSISSCCSLVLWVDFRQHGFPLDIPRQFLVWKNLQQLNACVMMIP